MPPGLAWIYEWLMAPLVFALAVRHAGRALGAGRAALELLTLVAYVSALEGTAGAVLQAVEYGPAWQVAPLGVPLALSLIRAALGLCGLVLAARHSPRKPLARAAVAGLLLLAFELLLRPVASAAGLLHFTPAGSWFGVPLLPTLAFASALGVYAFGAERWSGPSARHAFARFLVGSLGLLTAGGAALAVRHFGLEARLPPAAGWAVIALSCISVAALAVLRRWSVVGTSLASRMGVVPGHAPGLAFVLPAVALVTHAAFLEPATLLLAVLPPALALLLVAGGDVHRAALASWRERMHGRLSGTESLVAVLMKPRNGAPWTREERAFLRLELRSMARYLPALVLLLLPGSVVLLPLYAWLLDRRRGRSAPPRGRPEARGAPARSSRRPT